MITLSPPPARHVDRDVTLLVRWHEINRERLDLFYRACRSAAHRFVAAFNQTHSNAQAFILTKAGPARPPRLPCERSWMIP
ncbi:hypothetical protein ACFXG4_42920 [Nocardia sp. NPDC059246]|uniref:hypothetical protein n=1 Tax=unclassified Nocardia TaxID=2637762 RepID=UPI00369BF6AA